MSCSTITATGTLPAPQDVDTHDSPAFVPQAGTPGRYGSLTLDAQGHYTYTLNNASTAVQSLGAGETATDTFTYTAVDGHGGSAQNTLTVTINGADTPPTVAAATASTTDNTALTATGSLPAPQVVDLNAQPSFVPISNAQGQYGSLTLNADGTYTYTLNNASQAVQQLGAGMTAAA